MEKIGFGATQRPLPPHEKNHSIQRPGKTLTMDQLQQYLAVTDPRYAPKTASKKRKAADGAQAPSSGDERGGGAHARLVAVARRRQRRRLGQGDCDCWLPWYYLVCSQEDRKKTELNSSKNESDALRNEI